MSSIRLKEQFQKQVVAFNGSGKPLGERDDLHLLLKDAKATNDIFILGMFEEIPDDAELQQHQAASFEQKQNDKRRRRRKRNEDGSKTNSGQ